ncbi:hypothetical protein [Singulisphaera acidiphila]|uniref:Phytase-like domain-containing protein n=1 Tax=Singulisphaera acidiphila (strain ATCC BAA-1392 / DSM 18658 / VKM B-2454 / MOB10) TaxID=886293 RepID=L0DIZ7_SINAD|nr:hypothetical protein [Singulisphaera acidiphila]AGA29354.1 hypothetical protein Sinac_5202 [Singulisphaera acidiphila DSM 18658]
MALFTGIALALALVTGGPPLERVGRLNYPAIREASGIVASRRHPGIFWVHNDSGNLSLLFAVKRDGSLVREYLLQVPNVDWEDIAIDDDGHLYLGEIGNNKGRLPLRSIYQINEPDPTQPFKGTLAVEVSSFYSFPPEGRFDAEGLFLDAGRAVVVAKTFDRSEAELFAIPLSPPAPLLRPAAPESLGRLPRFLEPATGADLSRDGRLLAVCAVDVARVYQRDRSRSGPWTLVGTVRFPADHVEGIAWDGLDLILASENRTLYRISEARWRGSARDQDESTPLPRSIERDKK